VKAPRLDVETILTTPRRRNFAVLSTVADAGTSHSAGVTYGVSRPDSTFTLYVMTRRHLQKARNVERNPNVSLVVPVVRRLLWFLPPPCLQLRGRAEILDWTDAQGRDVFASFWMGRQILEMYRQSHRRGETRIYFLKITPDPLIVTTWSATASWS
jgi:Pyridoxamine 5'-phosphate oxidase